MTTRMECFLAPNKYPADSQLRADVIELGFAESGFGVPIWQYFDQSNGRVDIAKLTAIFDALDESLPQWVPLCANFEHYGWYWEEGPISGRHYVLLQQAVAKYMRDRYQRFISNWGSPNPIHPLAAEAARSWSGAALSGYWSARHSTGEYLWNARQKMKLASPFGLPRMVYVTPLVYPVNREDDANRMSSGQWNHVLSLCEWAVSDDPTTTFSFWLNRNLADSFIMERLGEMAERLG